MNRLTFVVLCAGLCLVPILFFAALQSSATSNGSYGSRGYHRGPSFLFMSFGNSYGGYSSRGRGYSSGGFRGGGSRAGK